MKKVRILLPAIAASALILSGCQTSGDIYRSDVYGSNQVNQAQQVQTVDIIAIQPARVAVNNSLTVRFLSSSARRSAASWARSSAIR